MLDLSRGVTRQARAVAEGRWEERGRYAGDELGGRTLGVVGYGSIGRRVGRLAAAFGMRAVAASREGRAPAPGDVPHLPLHELLAAADIVTLHLPLTAATRGFLGADELARMKPGALLVNTARGALVDHAALRAALTSGHLGGYAADVLDVEPPPADEPLLAMENVVLSPHVASLTAATYRRLCVSTAENVARVLRGEPADPGSLFRA
jgi:phosphoglycerate dehydrogenase-like enzyme